MSSILIVDDDDQLRQSFAKLLKEEGYDVTAAPSGEAGLEAARGGSFDLVVLDVQMPGMSGLEAFARIREIDATLPVIVMTAFGTTETAIEATKLGAFDYILKPFDIAAVLDLITQALEAGHMMRARVEMNVKPDTARPGAIIGSSPAMQEVYKAIGRVAPTDATVLIRGESGTGKELVARAVYQHSKRAGKPFLVINCVALPETLLESELFGYEKGAFTGAASRRIGKIEQANGGTVFLDEIGDMPLSIQAKILRLLQERSIERLGSNTSIAVDVRILAATNRNLERAIEKELFREDLYYRLKVVTIELPPLRDRGDDIYLLVDYFMALFSKEMRMDNPGLSDEARHMVRRHAWPGNVRELANALKKSLIFSRGYPVRPEDMSHIIASPDASAVVESDAGIDRVVAGWVRKVLTSREDNARFDYLTDRLTAIIVREALQLTGGNRSQAAKLLGLARPTLLSKIEKLNLSIETRVQTDPGME
ncbi:MAG: sigma-54-dependent transcriptional regulator [Thermodesulfobacteriota bacterium]